MKRIYILLMMIFAVSGVWGQINITSTGTPFTENFDAMLGTSATATLTANQWRAASNTGGTTWAGANLFATTQSGGTAVAVTAGGFYNYGNGIAASATDRALGFLSSGTAPWPGTSATPLSIYAQYTNATGATIAQFDGSFDIEKYRNGTNAQGFNILFYYSLDGNTWTVVGSASQNFPFNANNNAVNPATTTPRTFSISGLNIANGANFYLRWSYFVAAGVTATNAQGLGIDNISVTATGVIAGTPDIALSSPDPAVPSGNIVPGTGGNAIYRFDLAVTTVPANLTGISITTAGTHTAADLTQLRAYYSTDAVFDASDILLAIILAPGGPGAKSFNGFNRAIPDGTTGYIFISAHLACGATLGNTISVNAIAIADITFSSGNKTGSAFAGDAQTVIGVPPNNVTGAAASNGDQQSSVSWTNPVACYDEVLIVAATSANSGVPTGDGTAYTGDLVYGNGTPLGNGFVVYKGNASPQVVTALMNGTTYFFKIFGRFGTNWNSGVEVTATPTVPVITTYTWTGAGSWSTPGNWTPTRTSPAATDIIVFDGIGGTVTGVPTQTIGKLIVQNANITLEPATNNTLTIAGGTGTDLDISGALAVNNGSGSVLQINLATGATGSIAGFMIFTNGAHRLNVADAGAVTFTSGSGFTAGTAFNGNPFGTTSLNSVIFANGSAYTHEAGSNPFGAGQPASVVTFQTGSLYRVTGTSVAPSFSGRTYANIVFNNPAGNWTMTGGNAVIMDTLSVFAGIVNIGMTGAPGHSIRGNIYAELGTTLNFIPLTAGTMNLNGSVLQWIEHDGILAFNNNQTIVLNNAAGFITDDDVTFTHLTMTNGKFDINAHTISINGTLTGGSAASYFVTSGTGTVVRNVAATDVLFPVGPSQTLYHPATINNSGVADNFSVKVVSAFPPCAASATSVNATWDISEAVAGGSNCTISLDYTGATTGGAYDPATAQIVHCNGVTPDYHNGSVTGTIATGSGFTGFSPFGITNDLAVLPVSFASIKASQQSSGVKVEWSNQTETGIQHYVVDRSTDGSNFTSITTVNAMLNNGSRADYTYFDAGALNGTSYYRINAKAINGISKYSIIVKVNTKGGNTEITIYPNPVTGNQVSLQATALPKGQYTIRVINAGGQQVYTKQLLHNGGAVTETVQLPSTIKTGMYSIQLTGGEVNLTRSFIIR